MTTFTIKTPQALSFLVANKLNPAINAFVDAMEKLVEDPEVVAEAQKALDNGEVGVVLEGHDIPPPPVDPAQMVEEMMVGILMSFMLKSAELAEMHPDYILPMVALLMQNQEAFRKASEEWLVLYRQSTKPRLTVVP